MKNLSPGSFTSISGELPVSGRSDLCASSCVSSRFTTPRPSKSPAAARSLICATRSRSSIRPTSTRWRRRCACAKTAGGEVIALTVGGPDAEDVAHEAVAIGADKGILVTGGASFQLQLLASSIVTSLLAAAIEPPGRRSGPHRSRRADGRRRRPGPAPGRGPGLAGAAGCGSAGPDSGRSDARSSRVKMAARWRRYRPSRGRDPARPRAPALSSPGAHRQRLERRPGGSLDHAADLGLADLAPDTELGGLILGPERIRGQVIKGGTQEAAAEVAGVLRARRLI